MKTPKSVFLQAAMAVSLFTLPALALSKHGSEHAGAQLFKDKGCAYCHGPLLQGTQKGPALTNVRKAMKAPQIAGQIENGGQKMPPFGDSLSHDEIMQLVLFLRAKHPAASPSSQTPAVTPE